MHMHRLATLTLDPAKLYNALYLHALSRPDVAELTVEDPAEAFEDLRDRCDLRYLVQQGILDDSGFSEGVGADIRGPRAKWEEKIRKGYKIAQVSARARLSLLALKQHRRLLTMTMIRRDSSIGCWRCCYWVNWTRRTR